MGKGTGIGAIAENRVAENGRMRILPDFDPGEETVRNDVALARPSPANCGSTGAGNADAHAVIPERSNSVRHNANIVTLDGGCAGNFQAGAVAGDHVPGRGRIPADDR